MGDVLFRNFDVWEQILNQSFKQLQIFLQELGSVTVLHGLNQNDLFGNHLGGRHSVSFLFVTFAEVASCLGLLSLLLSFSFQRSCHNKYRFDSSHTEIVMILLAELFAG